MPISRIQTLVAYVTDVAASKAFYAGALGLPVAYESGGEPDGGEGGGVCALQVGEVRLLLHHVGDQDRGVAGRFEPYLQVDDVRALVAELAAAGVPVVREPTEQPWGELEALVRDPDGVVVGLTQPLAGSWIEG